MIRSGLIFNSRGPSMPAITTTTIAPTPPPLSFNLKNVLNTNPNEWKKFYEPSQIKLIFSELASQIQEHNFFTVDSIGTFFYFLKGFIQSEINTDVYVSILQNINEIFSGSKRNILDQEKFTEKQIELTVNFLQFVNVLFKWQMNKNYQLTFKIKDLSEITTHIVKNRDANAYIRNLISSYLSIMKSSSTIEKFLLAYPAEDFFSEEIVRLAKLIYSQQDSQALFTIPHFFSALAYEANFIADSDNQLNITSENVRQRQVEIINTVTKLQDFFLEKLTSKHNIPEEGLKFLFFKYFSQEATKIKDLVINHYGNLTDYSNEHFDPLAASHNCFTDASNKFVIKHAGLTEKELEVICQAKKCAESNYKQWLDRMGVNSEQLPKGIYIYHVSKEPTFDAVLNYYYKHEPISSAFYQAMQRNATQVTGWGFAGRPSKLHQQWQTTAHEYTHHLNFQAFGHLPSNLNEGLAYRLILSPCIDDSFRRWLDNNYTFTEILSKWESGSYDPSTLFMSYLVDTNPTLFPKILQSYRNYDDRSATEKIKQLFTQGPNFNIWLGKNRDTCKNFTLGKLGEGDGYCPPLLANDLIKNTDQNSFLTTLTLPLSRSQLHEDAGQTFLTASQLTPDEMGRVLIFKISERKFDEFRTLLINGANPNFCEETTGNTPLHFLYYYGNCDVQYLELLLKNGAKVTPNLQGQFPLQMAEKTCDAMELLKIHETLTRHVQQQRLPLTIVMPIASFVNGTISGWSGEIAQRNSGSPYIPSIIFYGLKPVTLAMSNSAINLVFAGSAEAIGLDNIGLSFIYYLLINYVGLMFAQFGERISNKIQNKFLNMVMSILLYTFFLNPSLLILLISEGFMALNVQSILQPLLSLLSGGIFFKAGEYSGQKFYQKFFPINPSDTVASQQDYFLRYSLDGAEKRISVEEKTLQEIKDKLEHFNKKLKKHIDEQAYLLSFDENFKIANDNLLLLLNKCQENEESYGKIFDTFKANLRNIQKNLNSLLEKIQSKKDKSEIKTLWNEITNILPLVSQIQPLPLVQKAPDLVANHGTGVTEENEQSLSLIKSINGKANGYPGSKTFRYTRPPTMLEKMYTFFVRPAEQKSEFPDPPTQEQLHEMGIFTKENDRKFNLNGS